MKLLFVIFILKIATAAAASSMATRGIEHATAEMATSPTHRLGVKRHLEETPECAYNENNELVCPSCRADGTLCVTETDYYNRDTNSMMVLSCVTSGGYQEARYTYYNDGDDNYKIFTFPTEYQFCYTSLCEISASTDGATHLDSCSCTSASLNGQTCSSCEFCTSDTFHFAADNFLYANKKPTDLIKLDCPISYATASRNAVTTMTTSDWSSSTCPKEWARGEHCGAGCVLPMTVALALLIFVVFLGIGKRFGGADKNLEESGNTKFQRMQNDNGAFPIPATQGIMS
jgi:hypothetical protein